MNLELFIRIFVVLHLIGFAALMTGFFSQMKEFKNGAKITAAIFHGSWTLLITGFALAGMVPSNGETLNNIVLAAKSVVITVIFFLAYSYNKKTSTPKWVVPVIGLLGILNVSLAIFGPIVVSN